ncbi:Hypothetical predicted protein [Pelobates cultripes]|uniref:Tubulin epsilon and delta complex protein 2 n=1 Tax=Pelobates cultripes TaxID=61616 RepID=A0AAD1SRH4_PELCU|nr:Hypothetical predicted protein [Pelobates cultripes]
MLSADCSHRLLSLLNQAILNCKEKEKKLEQQLTQYHALLREWRTDEFEDGEQDTKPDEIQNLQSSPSAKEIQEVEILSKALEKALKVRTGSRPQTAGARLPLANAQVEPPCPSTKTKPLIKCSHPGRKPMTYQLNPPYKTNPEKKRAHGSSRGKLSDGTRQFTSGVSLPDKERRGCAQLHKAKEGASSTDTVLGASAPPTVISQPLETQEAQDEQKHRVKHLRHALRLPVEYRRLYTKNSRLWDSFYDIQRPCPSSQPSFLERLQQTFVPGCPSKSLFELQEEISCLKNSITRIRQNIDSLQNWRGTGSRDWHDYRCMLVCEALLEEVSQHHLDLNALKQAAQQHLAWNKGQSTGASCEEITCSSMPRMAPAILRYNHPSELSQLICCKHRVLELKEKIYLQKVLNKELLSEMDLRCHSDPESWLLYRAIYTQLCEGGDAFPVLVHEDN